MDYTNILPPLPELPGFPGQSGTPALDRLPPTPRELWSSSTTGLSANEMLDHSFDIGKPPGPSPRDIERTIVGFVPKPEDFAQLGEKVLTGGIEDKVLIASSLIVPPILVASFIVGVVGLVIMTSK